MIEKEQNIKCEPHWTVLSLKEYVCGIFQEYSNKVDLRFDLLDKAVTKAEMATDKRFDSVNEFRAQLADQSRTFIPRVEAELTHRQFEDRINLLKESIDRIEARKEGGNITWLYIVAVLSILFSVSAIIIDLLLK